MMVPFGTSPGEQEISPTIYMSLCHQ